MHPIGRVVGIDQGTTSTRALVREQDGACRIVAALRHAQHYPRAGWVEHDPLELLANLRTCHEAAGVVDAVGLANQGESCLAWDARSGEPLSPVIVWQDNRTAGALAALRAEGAEAETLARAGLPLDPYFSASKFAWLLQHSPEVQAARRDGRLRLGTTDAFFLDRLTGTFATDATTASRTSLMNLESATWDPVLCELFGIPPECLPEIRDTVGDFGVLGAQPVRVSLVDQQAALFGHGCRAAGDAKITFGTGAFALCVTGGDVVHAADRGLFSTVAWRLAGRSTFAVEGGVYDAGSALEWAHRLGLFEDFAELAAFRAPPAISRGLVFVPAISGLACPHWDRDAGALWIGMTAATTKSDLCQAILEGVALRAAEVISAMDAAVPVAGTISIDGGLSRSDYFVRFLADVLERPIVRPVFDELTALGCAALAAGAPPNKPGGPSATGADFRPRDSDAGRWRERYAEAIARSRHWRTPPGHRQAPC